MANKKIVPRREADLQNLIRIALNDVQGGMYFRANVGQGWTGNQITRRGSTVIIHDARPFSTGLPPGFCDIFGVTPRLITADDVGKTLGIFTAIEVKLKTKPSLAQKNFLELCQNSGSLSGVAYNVDDALDIVNQSVK